MIKIKEMKTKSLAKAFALALCVLLSSQSFAQGWVGNSPNSMHGVDAGLGLGVNVGIGIASPTAQFHTTNDVRFEGLPTGSTQNQFLVSDALGNISLRPGNTIGNGTSWLLTGNNLTGGTGMEFIGTTSNDDFRIRTNNLPRMIVTSAGRVGVGQTAQTPVTALDLRYQQNLVYTPNYIDSSGIWRRDGLRVFNDVLTGTNNAATITLAAHDGSSQTETRAFINGVASGIHQMDITFQTEYGGPSQIRESMRISANGFVGINTTAPAANRFLHVNAGNNPIRFQNLPLGAGQPLVIDGNGDIFIGKEPYHKESEDKLQKEIDLLREELNQIKKLLNTKFSTTTVNSNERTLNKKSWLKQSFPNPGSNVRIDYHIRNLKNEAYIIVNDINGNIVQKEVISRLGDGTCMVSASGKATGLYQYSLIIDGEIIDTKKMILKH